MDWIEQVDGHTACLPRTSIPLNTMLNKYRSLPRLALFACLPMIGSSAWHPLHAQEPPKASPDRQAPTKPTGAAQPSSSKLTPEERQRRKQAKMQQEMEAEQRRIETFGIVPDDDTNPLAVEYRQATTAFQKATADYADAHVRVQYRMEESISNGGREKWLEGLKRSFEAMVLWRNKGAELYASNPEKYADVGLMLREMLIADGKADRFDRWSYAAKALLSSERLIDEDVLLYAGYVGFAECDFELATKAWAPLAEAGKLPETEMRMLQELPLIEKSWLKELERLQADQSKNNPRVEILTTKGVMEIELFEDEAPQAVANFIYLVENGYYTRKPIFLVRQHLLAQTGCEKGDGKGTAGYTIRSEAQAAEHRCHFRGSLALPVAINTQTNQLDLDSGGAQFYFSFLPLPILDGKHTVFGRVVNGIESLGLFRVVNLTDEEERKNPETRPDTIVSAKVLRKRDHEYRPTPVLGRLPR